MFQPALDTVLVITLPGEQVRAPVVRLWDEDTVICELTGHPPNQAKLHTYRKGDLVPVQRTHNGLGEVWEALDERLLVNRPLPGEEPPMPPKKVKRATRKVAVKKKGVKRAAHSR